MNVRFKDRAARRAVVPEVTHRTSFNATSSVSQETNVSFNNDTRRRNFRCVRTVVVLTVVTYAWLPGLVGFTQSGFPEWIFVVVNVAGICSTWWNGIIYVATNKNYRSATKDRLRFIFRMLSGNQTL